jgi:hypothetical protein
MPRSYPRYVTKDLFATYLESYAIQLGLDVRLGTRVERIDRQADGRWSISASDGLWTSTTVVVATGKHRRPWIPAWPGVDRFGGRLLHTAEYHTGSDFAGLRALVIGIGNSGAEIATDLIESGAFSVSISVRTTPPISSRDLFGIPVQLLGILMAPFPPRIVDRLGSILRRASTGDLTASGLGSEAWGPFTSRRPPVIDVGIVKNLMADRIQLTPDVDCFTTNGIRFTDGSELSFDVVVAATGFTSGLENLIDVPGVLDERGNPLASRRVDGLLFAGYRESPRGHLFEMSREARILAKTIDRYLSRYARPV